MRGVKGNTTAVFQIKKEDRRNEIGESEQVWNDVLSVTGWFDLSGGDSKRTSYNAKIQESTHIFLCDYEKNIVSLPSEQVRILIDNRIYDVMLIDDPMNLHRHIEIYLKYTGGQNG